MGTGKVALGGGVGLNLLIMVDTRVEGLCDLYENRNIKI